MRPVSDPTEGVAPAAGFNERMERIAAVVNRERAPVDAFERVISAFYPAIAGEPLDEPSLTRDVDDLSAEDLAFAHFVGSRLLRELAAARDNVLTLASMGAKPRAKASRDLTATFERVADLVNRLTERGPEPTVPPAGFVWPDTVPQPTFEEVKRLARGFALAPKGTGWYADVDEIALIHDEKNRARYNLRLEGALIPEWWGRPNDTTSLMLELRKIGPHATAMLLISVGLLVTSPSGHVDFDIDDLLQRAGVDPRSSRERLEKRHEAWRILTLIGATRVVGERRKKIYDRTTRRYIEIESTDPLLTVSPWVETGTQISFDASAPPIRVSAGAGRLIDEWRGNRTALQYFGDVIAISSIPAGKPSGEWARALGFALQQLWREQATRATFGRVGDAHRPTARFDGFTRRQLLGLFPPQVGVDDVLASANPQRAIKYWNEAIRELEERRIIGHCGTGRDWGHDRPRKGWASAWLDEPLDIRPPAEAVTTLAGIATTAKVRKKRRRVDSKLRESTAGGGSEI